MAERPFTFPSGCKLKWFWQRWIYSVISVELLASPAHNAVGNPEPAVIPVDLPAAPAHNDVENPESAVIPAPANHRLEDSSDRVGIITWFRRTMIKFSSAFQNSFTRVPAVKRIYNKKMMHKEVTALLKVMLTQLERPTARHKEFFESSDVLKTAMKYGTTDFVVECLESFPDLIWHKTRNERILQVAVEERNSKVLDVIYKLSADHKDDLVSKRDKDGNNVLHYVAKLPASHHLNLVLGAPLQMQREMQWFKGVESLLPEKYRLVRNKDGETAQQIFTKAHKPLVDEAEKWLKGTSESCMLVTTLIATVTFAAAITVPGGNISDTSNKTTNVTPIFLHKDAFMVFAIADALSLFSSITSVLIFLSILTSRYAEVDFLVSLPRKLIIGLFTIFLSLVTLMVAFGAALYVVLGHKVPFWAPIPVACVPVATLLFLQYSLFKEIVLSTCRRSIFRRHKHRSAKLKAE